MDFSKLALVATVATVALSGCSTNHQQHPKPSPVAAGGECTVNPKTEPMPATEEYHPVPADARISVTVNGIPSGIIKPGDPPTEIDVTLCNDSPVDYPAVGITTVLTKCSCATNSMGLPDGRIQRFDTATNTWVPLWHPIVGRESDSLGGFTDVQPLPKGRTTTVRYRMSLMPSVTAGKGSISTAVVVPAPLVEVGKTDLPFTVLKDSPKETRTPSIPVVPSKRQSTLPFPGLTTPWAVAADANGNVYVSEQGRVVKLVPGSNGATELPIAGVKNGGEFAVDGAGNLYVIDFAHNRVVKQAAGSNQQSELPFPGLDMPQHVAVDNDGTVYVTDTGTRVLKLPAGASAPTELPLGADMTSPNGVGVDSAHNLYIADSQKHRVLKFVPGSNDPTTFSIGGLQAGRGFAVNAAGDVYVVDSTNRQVLKRPAGSSESMALPFVGLNGPDSVAVDGAGNVYVLDETGFGRVVKLAASG